MKKSFILLIIFSIFFLYACERNCKHKWLEGDCLTPRKCSICGEINTEKGGHNFEDGICSICGNIDEEYILSFEPDNELISFLKQEKSKELNDFKELLFTNVNDKIKVNIKGIVDLYINKINNSESVSQISELSKKCINDIYNIIPKANGEFDFSNLGENEKEKIITALEHYLLRTNLCGIPINQYYSLNINSLNSSKWKEFFGVNGSKKQTAETDYWNVNPLLSNEYFIKGISLSIDKNILTLPQNSSIDFSNYDIYKFDKELARKYFKIAMCQLVEENDYSVKLINKPIEVTLELAFGLKTPSNEIIFEYIEKNLENVFNHPSVTNNIFVLNVKSWYGEYFGQIYSEKLYNGNFDLSFDKISGSSLASPNYYEMLSSTLSISNYMTVNWSVSTDDIEDDCIIFDNYKFSYDAMLLALKNKITLVEGEIIS